MKFTYGFMDNFLCLGQSMNALHINTGRTSNMNEQWELFVTKVKRVPEKILKWKEENIIIELRKHGFEGVDAEDVLDYWRENQGTSSSSITTEDVSEKYFNVNGLNPKINFSCARKHATGKLIEVFRNSWAGGQILVQAPPGTGKTAFISLFQFHYIDEFNIVSVSLLGAARDTPEQLDRSMEFNNKQLRCAVDRNKSLWDILDDKSIWVSPNKPLILLVDESQLIITEDVGKLFMENVKWREGKLDMLWATIFFSIYSVNTFEIAVQKRSPSISGTWVYQFYYADLLQWVWEDAVEFFNDFESFCGNMKIKISEGVRHLIYTKCDGHGGYIAHITRGIQLYGKNEDVLYFDESHWLDVVNEVRSTALIRDLLDSKDLQQAVNICQELLVVPGKKLLATDENVRWLTKLGIIIADNQWYTFSSPVMRVIFLRMLVTTAYAYPNTVLFKDPLSFLLCCLPLIKQEAIEKCLALTSRDGQLVQKEDVWVSKIFAAATGILPSTCVVDPQFSSKPPVVETEEGLASKRVKKNVKAHEEVKGKEKESKEKEKEERKQKKIKPPGANHGEVDIVVHNSIHYLIEFLFTEASTDTAETYILEHLSRFSPDGKYLTNIHLPCAVVNVTHLDPPCKVDIPNNFTVAQLYHFIVDHDCTKAKLVWQDLRDKTSHSVEIKFGLPLAYDPTTKTTVRLSFGSQTPELLNK